MITDDQITALAREFAEEYTKKKYPNAPGHVRERIVEGRLEHMEDFIPWLLRRFCLVEKEKLKAIRFRKVYNAEDVRSKFTEECLIDALFPEIAKEVQK